MINIVFYLLSVWGLTHILVSSKILTDLRNWLLVFVPFIGEMLECYQCSSFWSSIFLWFFFDNLEIGVHTYEILQYSINISPLVWGFIGSGIISFLSALLSLIIKFAREQKDI